MHLRGTAYAVDREQLAADLGFAFATRNSLDSVSDRDHIVELLSTASFKHGSPFSFRRRYDYFLTVVKRILWSCQIV